MHNSVTSVSGPRSSPDPVRFCAQYASSARHARSDSSTFCDPRSLRLRYPTTGRRLMQSFYLAPLPPPRSPRSTIHVSSSRRQPRPPAALRSLDVLSQRAAKGPVLESPREVRRSSPRRSRSFYPRYRPSSAGVSPPTFHQHRVHRFAWWSPLPVPCSGF
jgi:hypothetical protein